MTGHFRKLALAMAVCAWSGTGFAEPRVPVTDDEVVARLPEKIVVGFARRPVIQTHVAQSDPNALREAVRVARLYVDAGRTTGDPRYAGYAQAALRPWWKAPSPPAEVLVLRAILKQRVHAFDDALADLDRLLALDPRNGQARLIRATILQVQGRFEDAETECARLQGLVPTAYAAACAISVAASRGALSQAREALERLIPNVPPADPGARAWTTGLAAELAERAGETSLADRYYRDALSSDPDDQYLLGAYADFLLDRRRAREVIGLLADRTGADPLLLRLAIAKARTGAADRNEFRSMLRDRFKASRRRGDRVHLREEARYHLQLEVDVDEALELARQNWRAQKELADARVLLEAGLAADDASAVAMVRSWIATHRIEDVRLERLATRDAHPIDATLRKRP